MNIFLTGATGYIGSIVARRLKETGHNVVGLARSEASAQKLKELQIELVLGTLQDREKLIEAAHKADAVIHTAFIHDYSDFAGAIKTERDVLAAFTEALADSGKPFIATSGTGLLGDSGDRVIDDSESFEFQGELTGRAVAEQDIVRAAQQNIRSVALRLPIFIYGRGGSQFIPFLINDAKQTGVARYIEPGDFKYSVVHVDDAAELYIQALQNGKAGSIYHAVSESGVTSKAMTEAVARMLGYKVAGMSKEEAIQVWGIAVATFFSLNNQISCSKAEKELGWKPSVKTTILEDIEHGSYKAI
ncbi:MAG: SDR family oxidoreductase [Iphinoe sp. HA4291-MV1]|jgi:nucleoside-diphosphate-sugar epimerase|nr:SDR family oxidoreductase [Iphinoe sp. HA4291-MV1]